MGSYKVGTLAEGFYKADQGSLGLHEGDVNLIWRKLAPETCLD